MKRRQSFPSIATLATATGTLLLLATAGAGCGGPEYPNCNNDSDCHESEFCVNGRCQQCRPDANDCRAGQHCMGGRCEDIPGWCASDTDCPNGQECRDNQCVAAQVATSEPVETEAPACTLTTVYFAYDSSELDSSARDALETNAQCIQQRNIPRVTLTGHTDPRGTEEYNLALGERRAQSVQTYIQRLGVDGSHVNSRSMGEEMARGSDESGWSRDRRVQFDER